MSLSKHYIVGLALAGSLGGVFLFAGGTTTAQADTADGPGTGASAESVHRSVAGAATKDLPSQHWKCDKKVRGERTCYRYYVWETCSRTPQVVTKNTGNVWIYQKALGGAKLLVGHHNNKSHYKKQITDLDNRSAEVIVQYATHHWKKPHLTCSFYP